MSSYVVFLRNGKQPKKFEKSENEGRMVAPDGRAQATGLATEAGGRLDETLRRKAQASHR
jgi:hypothetical protein